MGRDYVAFDEVVEMFLYCTVVDLKNEADAPNVNFSFNMAAYELFIYIKDHPFTKEGYSIPNIDDKDIERLRKTDDSVPTIYVKDHIVFFKYLMDITNALVDINSFSGRSAFINHIKRIWMRMGPSDFYHVEDFLKKQLDFIKSTVFDDYKFGEYVEAYEGYEIKAKKVGTRPWYEASNKMCLSLYLGGEEMYTLPSIYFGICEENGTNVCYIYAVQNERQKKADKKALRKIYKLNAGIQSPDVHPSSVLALITFMKMLEQEGIFKIKVPLLQVLSLRYHEILSRVQKKDFYNKWKDVYVEDLESLGKREEYDFDLLWYDHVVDREEFIEKAKTEGLINMFLRLEEQFSFIQVLTDPFIEDEYLNVCINQGRKRIK